MKTVHGLFAECKTLSDDELFVLINSLQSEISDRKMRDKREAWKKVVDAINAYTEDYDSIEICDGDCSIYLHAKQFTYTLGEIQV